MWLFEKRGFISVVAYDPKKDRNKSSKFPQIAKKAGTHLLVRARIKEDLEMLKSVLPTLHIETDPSADYSFRCVIPRSKFKKFLAEAVDGITYDSHFKEVAREHSKGSSGRYSAMMKVWGNMADLQPYSPYGGYFRGPEGKSSASTKSNDGWWTTGKSGMATPKASPAKVEEFPPPTLDDWFDDYARGFAKDDDYRRGLGPETGFSVGDEVVGWFGQGEVINVESREDKPDMVKVKYDKKGKEVEAVYVSTYLVPVTEVPENDDLMTLDETREYLTNNPDLSQIDTGLLGLVDDDGFELVTRLQEKHGVDSTVTVEQVIEVYDEVAWERASDSEKISMASEGTVPEKFVHEATNLFSHKDS